MVGGHAVVVGASMGGLLAAAALAERYDRVTVIDRDVLPAGLDGRRGVPQGRHAHALLAHGQACLEELLPGLSAELVAAGAATCAVLEEMRLVIGGQELARPATGNRSLYASRPFFEGHVRRRVRALPGVTVLDRRDVLGLTTSAAGRVTGVRVLSRADGSSEELLAADLVVTATGRGARLGAWLEGLGFARPAEETLGIDVVYASRHLRLPEGALGRDGMVLITAVPGRPRALFLFPQEGGRHILSVGGYGPAHHPPTDDAGFAAFAASVAPPDVAEVLRTATPLGEVATHRFPASVRRRYERLERFPDGLLVCGDAICAFNPTYGQGMTVAAAQALALRDCLRDGEAGLARRFFAAAAEVVDHAWMLSVGGDLALPEVRAPRPLPGRALGAYMARLRATAAHDPAVARALAAVIAMLERPPSLLRPAVARAVVRGPRPRWSAEADGVRRSVLRVAGTETPLREAGPPDAEEAVVFIHGNPGSSADWEPLLARVGVRRRALAWDAPGFGGARAPAGFEQTVGDHAAFVGAALAELGVARAHLVLHDFGGPWGLHWAAAQPERFASAVLLNTGALPGYRWHALARLWRTPVAGELFMATTTRPGFRALLRRGQRAALPRPFVDRMYADFDRETRQAVLDLYRSVPDVAEAGRQLAAALAPLDRPALVLWGRDDPYLGVENADRQCAAFPHAEVRVLDRAGHWPWVDRPAEVGDALEGFLLREASARPALAQAA